MLNLMLDPIASYASKISDEQFVRGILIAIPVDLDVEIEIALDRRKRHLVTSSTFRTP